MTNGQKARRDQGWRVIGWRDWRLKITDGKLENWRWRLAGRALIWASAHGRRVRKRGRWMVGENGCSGWPRTEFTQGPTGDFGS